MIMCARIGLPVGAFPLKKNWFLRNRRVYVGIWVRVWNDRNESIVLGASKPTPNGSESRARCEREQA